MVYISIKLLGHYLSIEANIKLNPTIILTEITQMIKQSYLLELFIVKTFKISNTIIIQRHSE